MTVAVAMTYWCSTFAFVFSAGFQSRNVNAGRYLASAAGTLAISTVQIVMVRGIASGDPFLIWLLTVTAGIPAIWLAIWLSHRIYGSNVATESDRMAT